MKKILIPLLILFGFCSCSNYYKAALASEPGKSATFNDFKDTKKYYILRAGSEAFAMKNIAVSNDNKNLQCTLEEIPFEHQVYIKNVTTGKMKYKDSESDNETGVLNEVHIYITPGNKIATGLYTLAFENIQKAETIEKDKVKTKRSHTAGTIIGISGAVVGVVVIAAVIIYSNTFPIF